MWAVCTSPLCIFITGETPVCTTPVFVTPSICECPICITPVYKTPDYEHERCASSATPVTDCAPNG